MSPKSFFKLILILIIAAFAGCNLQKNMLYYPDSHIPSREELAAEGIQYWPSAAAGYRGFAGTVPITQGKGTILVFHGNAGTASDRTYYVQSLASLGYRVILAEYPGYGGRDGEPGETVFVNDAKETLRIASEQYGNPLYLLGESLGSGVTAAVANDAPAVEGLILITPWDTLLSVAQKKFPWLPVRLFLRDKYDTIGNLKGFQGRIAIIGAERDEIIPIGHALALYESLPGNKKMWTIKGAGHNDWPDRTDASLWKEITDFIAGSRQIPL